MLATVMSFLLQNEKMLFCYVNLKQQRSQSPALLQGPGARGDADGHDADGDGAAGAHPQAGEQGGGAARHRAAAEWGQRGHVAQLQRPAGGPRHQVGDSEAIRASN